MTLVFYLLLTRFFRVIVCVFLLHSFNFNFPNRSDVVVFSSGVVSQVNQIKTRVLQGHLRNEISYFYLKSLRLDNWTGTLQNAQILLIDLLILTVCQPVEGYFIPRSKGITFISVFLRSCLQLYIKSSHLMQIFSTQLYEIKVGCLVA